MTSGWFSVAEILPDPEVPVLAYAPKRYDAPFIGAMFWERCNPYVEPYFEDFLYWNDYHNDSKGLEYGDVLYWKPLPRNPGEQ